MGQKTHPTGFRLGIVKDWSSRWYAERDFPRLLMEDETIRKYLRRRLSHAALAQIDIDRTPSKIVVTLHTARPGVVIGKRGSEVDKLRDELGVLTKSEISVNVEEIKRPEVSAYLVAENVAHQLRHACDFLDKRRRCPWRGGRCASQNIIPSLYHDINVTFTKSPYSPRVVLDLFIIQYISWKISHTRSNASPFQTVGI